jgi:hypothetical protein
MPTPTPDPADALQTILDEVRSQRALLERLESLVRSALPPRPVAPPAPAEQLVTLDQAAATVRRSKRALEKYRGKGLPAPRIQGRRGHPHLWLWADLRPWLERTFGFHLPEQFPGVPG